MFREVNESGAVDDLNDDAHEFSYDEYKTGMLMLCSELGVPIVVNGRDIAARVVAQMKKSDEQAKKHTEELMGKKPHHVF